MPEADLVVGQAAACQDTIQVADWEAQQTKKLLYTFSQEVGERRDLLRQIVEHLEAAE